MTCSMLEELHSDEDIQSKFCYSKMFFGIKEFLNRQENYCFLRNIY